MVTLGISSNNLEVTALAIAAALGLQFMSRESSFRGGNYYSAETVRGTVLLQSNCDTDAVSKERFEDDWPINWLVLYFSGNNDEAWNPDIEKVLALTELQPTVLSKTFG